MGKTKSSKTRGYGNSQENRMARAIDEKREFEDFKTLLGSKVARELIQDVKSGMSAKELREKYSTYLQARQIAIALASTDDGKADAAAQRVLDRAEGKATEKKEIKHAFSEMSDEELDAILKSEQEDLEDMSDRFDH